MVVVNKESIESVARLAVMLIASVCTILGWSFNEELWANLLITAFSLFWLVKETWWKNQNVTEESQEGQKVTDGLKAGDFDGDETEIYMEADDDAVFPGDADGTDGPGDTDGEDA